jgi:hypothetical protein
MLAIGTLNDEISDLAFQLLAVVPLNAILKRNCVIVRFDTNGMLLVDREGGGATGAGIYQATI